MSSRDRYYRSRFSVKGKGRFPMDMLRYDRCCPDSETDAINMRGREQRTIVVCRFSPQAQRAPSIARWQSFGWIVGAVEQL